jgi:hypothetical protein
LPIYRIFSRLYLLKVEGALPVRASSDHFLGIGRDLRPRGGTFAATICTQQATKFRVRMN